MGGAAFKQPVLGRAAELSCELEERLRAQLGLDQGSQPASPHRCPGGPLSGSIEVGHLKFNRRGVDPHLYSPASLPLIELRHHLLREMKITKVSEMDEDRSTRLRTQLVQHFRRGVDTDHLTATTMKHEGHSTGTDPSSR